MIGFYLFVVSVVSLAVALYERWMMDYLQVGWGKPLPTDRAWGKQLSIPIPFNIVDPLLFTRYHITMFFVIVPTLLTVTILMARPWVVNPPSPWYAWIIFVVACVLGVMVLEDFLFFVVNSLFGKPYPNALARLFRGEAHWHPRWINFGFFQLPDFYVWMPVVIALLLTIVAKVGQRH